MAIPWLAIASGLYLVYDHVYNKEPGDSDGKIRPSREVQIPRVDPGSPVPYIFGRCRVRSPVLADLRLINVVSATVLVDMLFKVGIGMDDNRGECRVHDMWGGDLRAVNGNNVTASGEWAQLGIGAGPEIPIEVGIQDAGEGYAEFLNGGSTQVLANDGDTDSNPPLPTVPQLSPTWAGRRMLTGFTSSPARTVAEIGGFRGFLSVFLFHIGDGSGWSIGSNTSLPSYNFEASSYPSAVSPGGPYARPGGMDANPVDVIWDLLQAEFKLGIDASTYIDFASFRSAAYTCFTEGNGYSNAIEDVSDLGEHIVNILAQINGVLWFEPSDNKFHIKLIRADYNASSLTHITKDNCEKLVNFAIGGWGGLPTAVRVVFNNRALDYNQDDRTAMNQSNAVGQDGETRWVVLNFPGVTRAELAEKIALRELLLRSRPVIKCRALCTREMAGVTPGTAVKVTFSNPDVDEVFRVVGVDRGTLTSGQVALDLISEANYVPRAGAAKPLPDPHEERLHRRD